MNNWLVRDVAVAWGIACSEAAGVAFEAKQTLIPCEIEIISAVRNSGATHA